MLQKAAENTANIKLKVKAEELKALADPLVLVETCKVKGGPAPEVVEKALNEWKEKLLQTKSHILQLDKLLEKAENALEEAVSAYSSEKRKT